MATLALGAIGAAVGAAALPSLSLLGTTLTGAAIGQAAGALLGSAIDQALLGGGGRQIEGPRLSTLQVLSSSEGAPVPRLYGRARLGGQMIWATRLEEEIIESQSDTGSKGLGGSSGASRTDYQYYANFAVGLCEGPVGRIGRIWADGKELDLTGISWRLYAGSDTQVPDSLIEAKEGAGAAPAYRGLAYVVFERLALERFGNRIPQLSFEVFKPMMGFETQVRSISIIPSAGEFVYEPTPVSRDLGLGNSASENVHSFTGQSDWTVAVDQLQSTLPNVAHTALIVSWFGDDLRAGTCTVTPRVDTNAKVTTPRTWQVAGLTRATARPVSQVGGRAAYGGTPTDASVIAAIADLKARGLAVTLTPFMLMDIAAGNGMVDPYGGTEQAAYPWRGRISVNPAVGRPGTVDKTAAAAVQLASFTGTAQRSDFSIASGAIVYSGPAEWSYRRFILHYAYLCQLAGGVDAFIIGSELRGLTTARSGPGTYQFVTALVALAADVRTVLGPSCMITYAADWSEYFGHQPGDGSGDVYFHLDPLWAAPAIDAIGIDAYWPLADWRDGRDHADAVAGANSTYELGYLKGNVFAGEGYDWYYANAADRANQVRTPISDGAGKPWVFRYKDIRSWWNELHYNRPGGVEAATPTAWQPQSKPLWLTELGCPAIDRGANQPNVFVDPKSVESALPHQSRGCRDDLIQRRYLQAMLETFDPALPGFQDSANPVSTVYGGRMLDTSRITLYTWDARPSPAFPRATDVWSDGEQWALGHWLNGRLDGMELSDLVAAILDDHGFAAYDVAALEGTLDGYVVDRLMSARAALQPLELAFRFDSYGSGDTIRFQQRANARVIGAIAADGLVETTPAAALYHLTRRQETEMPVAAKYTFIDGDGDYRPATAEAKRLTAASARIAVAELPIVTNSQAAAAIVDVALHDAWAERTRANFTLPPSALAVEPGDIVVFSDDGIDRPLRVTGISDGAVRSLDLLSMDLDATFAPREPVRPPAITLPDVTGTPIGCFLDLPLLGSNDTTAVLRFGASQTPWPGGVALYRSAADSDYALQGIAQSAATIGVTISAFRAGPVDRWDLGTTLDVKLARGALATGSTSAVLAGANIAAISTGPGAADWEIVQFREADLIGPQTYRLSGFLRAQGGSDVAMQAVLAAGARFVLLNQALLAVTVGLDDVGLPFSWRFGPANQSLGTANYRGETRAITGIASRPLSPVRITGRRVAGDLEIGWIRRTRLGGDSWIAAEVPLGEASEAWEIEIVDGTAVKRMLTSATSSVTYSAAAQLADWGALPASVTVRIAQLSATFGRGTPRTATV
jgi:GTA TIM-barrel-like domain/Putative phage tail protein